MPVQPNQSLKKTETHKSIKSNHSVKTKNTNQDCSKISIVQ